MINVKKFLEDLISDIKTSGKTPRLLLHSCCAPCSSYVLEYLSDYFNITILYYNPNIYPKEEYTRRMEEQKAFLSAFRAKNPIKFIEEEYIPDDFYSSVKGLEGQPEGAERCFKCYALRLERAAKAAKEEGFDYFTTTLSISPYKNAQKLNEIGKSFEEKYNIKYLYSDFKKNNGYKRSIELSKEYGLYRQDYCGCVFSIRKST
ncbi:MAG: epoxyqueuosine reductase QueH [Eubacteriales bacterium]|jgi:predicted adenine nucleotide alpha hydrolase (AANH) superfamily ATPase|nr:epoxyqueuosine reductase QueH [Eubacteriales bacterium]